MRNITHIVVHGAFTKAKQDIGVEEIRRWHTDPKPKGNGWSTIGYHYVIRRDGRREVGLPLEQPGIHVKGKNAHTVAICLAGGMGQSGDWEFNYSWAQLSKLRATIRWLKTKFPDAIIEGHNGMDKSRPCPGFNVKEMFA